MAKHLSQGKKLIGTIVSDKMEKTVVVEVTRFEKHGKYQKYMKLSKRYKAHDPKNLMKGKVGEKVTIVECRPISKDKRFAVIYE